LEQTVASAEMRLEPQYADMGLEQTIINADMRLEPKYEELRKLIKLSAVRATMQDKGKEIKGKKLQLNEK
jgi:hypothetical protein